MMLSSLKIYPSGRNDKLLFLDSRFHGNDKIIYKDVVAKSD